MVITKYLLMKLVYDFTIHIVGSCYWWMIVSNMKKFTLIEVKKELPILGPLVQIVNVTVKRDTIMCSINVMI